MHRQFNFAIAIASLFLPVSVLSAQVTSIQGRVIDTESRLGLPGVNVFLANTTLGSSTNNDGVFQISGVPEGTFELVASMVGFTTASKMVETGREDLTNITFELSISALQLPELVVEDEVSEEWKAQLTLFEQLMLGSQAAENECYIVNPYVLSFTKRGDEFVAVTSSPLEVNLGSLGYSMKFTFRSFLFLEQSTLFSFDGYAQYSVLDPASKKVAKDWRNNRSKAFRGSFQHFLIALTSKTIKKAGFRGFIRDSPELVKKPTPYLLRGDEIEFEDFLTFLDSTSSYSLSFPDFLQVTYTKEPAEYAYFDDTLAMKRANGRDRQHSMLALSTPSVEITRSGYLLEPVNVVKYGYFAWENTLCNMLPLDYKDGE